MKTVTHSRIELIDALRGFTLLGIIIAHMVEEYYAGMRPEEFDLQKTSGIADLVVGAIVGILITGKFFMIFSFLFGMSFFIQLNKAGDDPKFLVRFFWRLVLLFLIGLIHHLHYRGDILTIYAMLGVVLLLVHRLPEKLILILGVLLVLDVPGILSRSLGLVFNWDVNQFMHQDQQVITTYYHTFKSGSYLDLITLNLHDFKTKMDYQVWSGRIYITAGLFLLGLYAGKVNFFSDVSSRIGALRKLLQAGAGGLAACVLLMIVVFAIGTSMAPGGMSEDANMTIWLSFADVFNASLTLIYVVGFMLLFQKEKWKNRFMYFYSAGRMGLTTYLTQSAFGLLIFSTLGLGLVGQVGMLYSFLLALVLFFLQILISNYWLSRFHYGPVEWIWRCLTNFKWYPLKKQAPSTAVN